METEKKYGPHEYRAGEGGLRDCLCGCWKGTYNAGGPHGLDPAGRCPLNPLDGIRLEGNQDIINVLSARLTKTTERVAEKKRIYAQLRCSQRRNKEGRHLRQEISRLDILKNNLVFWLEGLSKP